jgi:hypothetical protein
MKKPGTFLFALALVLISPLVASAHERQVFDISGTKYLFTVGSLNEPVVIDDKTGVDLRIQLADPANLSDGKSPRATPVTGLEKTLKVEVGAGDKKQTFNLSPAYGDAGAYRAVFFPTVATTYFYRVFGTINNTVVDLMFACATNSSHDASTTTAQATTKISDSVTRVFQAGTFGCPLLKSDLQFPEKASSLLDLSKKGDSSSSTFAYVALGLSTVAFVFSLRKR